MDGLDGLVAGCMLVAIAVLSFSLHLPWTIWTLRGSVWFPFVELESRQGLYG